MDRHDEDDMSSIPLEFVILSGLRRAIGVLLAAVLAFLIWVFVTGMLAYVAITAPDGSFIQSLASDLAVAIFLFGVAPLLLGYWQTKRGPVLLGFFLAAAVLVAASAFLGGGSRFLVMGFGCGIMLLLLLNYWIQQAWARASAELTRRTAEENARKTIVVGQ